jgi:hypothetical protein
MLLSNGESYHLAKPQTTRSDTLNKFNGRSSGNRCALQEKLCGHNGSLRISTWDTSHSRAISREVLVGFRHSY